MVRTSCFHCKEPGFDSSWGTKISELRYCSRAKKKKKKGCCTVALVKQFARAEGSIVFSSVVKKLHGPLHLFLK